MSRLSRAPRALKTGNRKCRTRHHETTSTLTTAAPGAALGGSGLGTAWNLWDFAEVTSWEAAGDREPSIGSSETPSKRAIVSAVMASRNDLDAHHGRLRRCPWWIGIRNYMESVGSREGYLGGGRW